MSRVEGREERKEEKMEGRERNGKQESREREGRMEECREKEEICK